jgi:hypothetical protein
LQCRGSVSFAAGVRLPGFSEPQRGEERHQQDAKQKKATEAGELRNGEIGWSLDGKFVVNAGRKNGWLGRIGTLYRRGNDFGQVLENQLMIGLKNIGLGRKNFDESYNCALGSDGSSDHGTDAESTAAFAVHTGIDFGVITAQQNAGAHTFSRKARADAQPRTHRGSVGTGGGAANHVGVFSETNGGGRRMREGLCAAGDQVQGGVKIRAEGFDFFFYRGKRGEDGGVVGFDFLPAMGLLGCGGIAGQLRATRKRIGEEPFPERGEGLRREIEEMDAGVAGGIRPDDGPGALDCGVGFRKVEKQILIASDFEGRCGLDRHAVFVEIQNLAEVWRWVVGGIQADVSGEVQFVAHTASPICMGMRGWLANLRRIGPEGRHTAVGYILLQEHGAGNRAISTGLALSMAINVGMDSGQNRG